VFGFLPSLVEALKGGPGEFENVSNPDEKTNSYG
jgi:hypothetical protein